MPHYVVIFFIIAFISAVLGIGGISGAATRIS